MPNDRIQGWLLTIFAFAVSFAALMMAQRRSMAWGAVGGCAAAVGVELA